MDGIYGMLFPYQKRIVDSYKDRQAFGLFLDMGLGKTPVSLAFAEVNKCNKVIVVTLNAKATEKITEKGSWAWWASKSNMNYRVRTKKEWIHKNPEFGDKELVIINYESIWQTETIEKKVNGRTKTEKVVKMREEVEKFIESCKGDRVAVIVDESHKIKEKSTNNYKCVALMRKTLIMRGNRTYLYLCTGTPFTAGLEDLQAQLNMLGCDITKTEFKEKYCIMDHKPYLEYWKQPIIGYKNVDDLYNLVHKYALTIKSNEVTDLPEQIFIYHKSKEIDEFKLLTEEKIDVKYLKGRVSDSYIGNHKGKVNNPFYRDLDYPDSTWSAETSGQEWLRARQISIGFQGNKENYAIYNEDRFNMLKEFLSNNEDNYIIFYNYVPEFILLAQICLELGYKVDVYNGDVKDTSYYDKYDSMSEDGKFGNKKNVILSNFASGSTGKNWQAYNKCILFSLPCYRDWEQGLKRIHRIGQNDTCFYHVFYQDNWLERAMLKALSNKVEYTKDMFEDDRIKELGIKK